jgi:hypothetical protein
VINPSGFKAKGSGSSSSGEATKAKKKGIVIRVKPTKNFHECFREVHAPIHIGNTSVKLLGENSKTVEIAMPSVAGTCCSDVKKVGVIHEIREQSCSVVLEDAPSLVSRDND